jgi:hypothetical protein
MAFTVYGLMTSATPAGPYWTSGDVTAITGANPPVGANFYGFVDGEQRSKFFYSSNLLGPAGAVALPTLATPNVVPTGFVQIGTSAIYASSQTAYVPVPAGGAAGITGASCGELFFTVQIQGGSPDAGSPVGYFVDPYTLFLVAAAAFELP